MNILMPFYVHGFQFPFLIFIYVEESAMEGPEIEAYFFFRLFHSPNILNSLFCARPKPGIENSIPLIWMSGTKYTSHDLLVPGVCIISKLEIKVKL